MSISETLSSLAILKATIDLGDDYHNKYLRPFIEQILHDDKPIIVKDTDISRTLESKYGLVIPSQVVQLILKRLIKSKVLVRDGLSFSLNKAPEDRGIATKKAEADREIQSVVTGLMEFSKQTQFQIDSHEKSQELPCLFLSHFSIQCVSSYLRGTAVPEIRICPEIKFTRVTFI